MHSVGKGERCACDLKIKWCNGTFLEKNRQFSFTKIIKMTNKQKVGDGSARTRIEECYHYTTCRNGTAGIEPASPAPKANSKYPTTQKAPTISHKNLNFEVGVLGNNNCAVG
jgi:hypothetical protein